MQTMVKLLLVADIIPAPQMHPILTSILLGLTAAAANVFGGAIIVQRHWERRYFRYFVALARDSCWRPRIVEVVPQSLETRRETTPHF